MAASAQQRSGSSAGRGGSSSIEAGLERLLEPALYAALGILAIASVLPLLLVAIPVYLALYALRRRSWRIKGPALGLCLVPALVTLLVAWVTHRTLPVDVAMGYVDVQLDTAVNIVQAVRDGSVASQAVDWLAYAQAVWPYGVTVGALVGGLGFAFHSFHRGSLSDEMKGNEAILTFRDAGDMAQTPERQMSWALPRVVGRGVVSLLSAPPGLGKGWWTWGLWRAMQDGGEFFGLEVRRPVKRAWWGGKERPLKVLWLTEEGQSFAETAKRFGIKPGLVTVLQRQDVAATDWPTIVKLVRWEAWRRGCAYVVVDTIRAWCPQAEQSNDQAAEVFNFARRELAAPGLGVLFVHHDRKGGGEYGEGVAGPNNLVGSCDVLIELKRVKGDTNARRMLVSRRFGDQDITATLDGVRYVVAAAAPADSTEGAPAPVPVHLQATLDAIRQAGPVGIVRKDVQAVTQAAGATLSRQCRDLVQLGLVAEEGSGSKADPYRYRLVDEQPVAPAPPTADPAYIRYLNSKAWAMKRDSILDRAGGACEDCGEEEPAEVHHLTYERVGDELPDDLTALCAPCHRRAHAG